MYERLRSRISSLQRQSKKGSSTGAKPGLQRCFSCLQPASSPGKQSGSSAAVASSDTHTGLQKKATGVQGDCTQVPRPKAGLKRLISCLTPAVTKKEQSACAAPVPTAELVTSLQQGPSMHARAGKKSTSELGFRGVMQRLRRTLPRQNRAGITAAAVPAVDVHVNASQTVTAVPVTATPSGDISVGAAVRQAAAVSDTQGVQHQQQQQQIQCLWQGQGGLPQNRAWAAAVVGPELEETPTPRQQLLSAQSWQVEQASRPEGVHNRGEAEHSCGEPDYYCGDSEHSSGEPLSSGGRTRETPSPGASNQDPADANFPMSFPVKALSSRER